MTVADFDDFIFYVTAADVEGMFWINIEMFIITQRPSVRKFVHYFTVGR